MENIDKTIEAVSEKIQAEIKGYDTSPKIIELVNALAALVTARANLTIATRMYSSGGTTLKRKEH